MLLSLVACKNQQDETQNGEQTPTMPTEDKIQYYDSPQYSSETLNVDYLKNNDYFRVVSEENSNIEKYFTEMQDRIVGFICKHSKAEKEKLISLMNRTDQLATDIGSIVEGQEAVELGIIDAVGGLSDAINEIKKHIEK